MASATWYWRLLTLRDELTHLGTGHLHTDHKTGLVHYDPFGLKEGDKPLSIEDVFGWLSTTSAQVNAFTGSVFHHLNRTLADTEIFQACGMVQGRMLWRYVNPASGRLTFNSGRCGAWTWFEKPELPTCPFVGFCGAYQRKVPAPPGDPPSVLESSPSAGRSKTKVSKPLPEQDA